MQVVRLVLNIEVHSGEVVEGPHMEGAAIGQCEWRICAGEDSYPGELPLRIGCQDHLQGGQRGIVIDDVLPPYS